MHVSIATRILREIKSRSLDKLEDIEEEIMKGTLSTQTKAELNAYLQSEVCPNNTDVVRLLVIMVLCYLDR